MSASPRPSPSAIPANLSYEQALEELRALVAQLESGKMPLDTMLHNYRHANSLLGVCRSRLQALEEQIQILDQEQARAEPGAANSADMAASSR